MKQGAPSAVDDARPPPLGSEGEESAGEVVDPSGGPSQMLEGHPVFLIHEDQEGHRAIHVKASLVEREVRCRGPSRQRAAPLYK